MNAASLPDGNGWHTEPGVPLPGGTAPHVAIVGGGIAGLAAAFFLRDAPVRVTVFEGSHRIGGKLAVSEIAGIGSTKERRRCSPAAQKGSTWWARWAWPVNW